MIKEKQEKTALEEQEELFFGGGGGEREMLCQVHSLHKAVTKKWRLQMLRTGFQSMMGGCNWKVDMDIEHILTSHSI